MVEKLCEHYRGLVLAEIRRFVGEYGRPDVDLYELMFDYPMRPAKALRPTLCIATARALGASESSISNSAAAIELLHNAFLIHDDVEDRSLLRRGQSTIQRRHGVPTAVNVADGMLAMALRPLLENTTRLGLGVALEILELIVRTVQITVEGQALELEWIRENRFLFDDRGFRAAYEDLVLRKTAYYSFVAPVLIGCIAGRASDKLRSGLEAYARHVAIAFQITDDVLNLSSDVDTYGKEPAGDLWEGKRTLVLLHAIHSEGSSQDRVRALAGLAKPRPLEQVGVQMAGLRQEIHDLESEGWIDAAARMRLELKISELGDDRDWRGPEDVALLDRLIRRHGSIEYARDVAREHAAAAASEFAAVERWLAEGMGREFLAALVPYVIERLW
jgi:geranylgeranyl diphosphate synthase type II